MVVNVTDDNQRVKRPGTSWLVHAGRAASELLPHIYMAG